MTIAFAVNRWSSISASLYCNADSSLPVLARRADNLGGIGRIFDICTSTGILNIIGPFWGRVSASLMSAVHISHRFKILIKSSGGYILCSHSDTARKPTDHIPQVLDEFGSHDILSNII